MTVSDFNEEVVTTRTSLPPSPHAPPRMSRAARFAVGVVAFGPLIGLAAALSAGLESAAGLGIAIGTLFWSTMALFLFGGYLLGGCRFSGVQQAGWSLAFLFAAPLSLPLFWFRHVLGAPRRPVHRARIRVTRVVTHPLDRSAHAA